MTLVDTECLQRNMLAELVPVAHVGCRDFGWGERQDHEPPEAECQNDHALNLIYLKYLSYQ